MRALFRSPFLSAALGGIVVAGSFLLLGVTGHRTTKTIVEEAPVAAEPATGTHSSLTPHEIYVRDAPGVVFVRAQEVEQVQNPFDLFPDQQSSASTGSGFLIDRAGQILTNYHVIEGANRQTGVTVEFADDVSRQAIVVGQDADNDLALLRVNMDGVPSVRPLPLGDSTTVQVGDPTLAIGNPFGLDRTLTSGIVSALQRQIQAPDGFSIDNVIQTDAPINPGNSGGPLLDATGHVIGINSQIATGGNGAKGSVGIAFAVPINTAKGFLPRLKSGGQIKLAYLGINGAAATRTRPGVAVQSVEQGSPADDAGLKRGDVVVAIGGQKVGSMGDVQNVVDTRTPGQTVVVRAVRGRGSQMFKVTLGSRPAQPPR
jgi:S1-C subfamily serine protease